jgi:queuine tRNA-ribosyltransferase
MSHIKEFSIKGKKFDLPVFFPDATRGVIRAIDSKDIVDSHTPGLIVNTFHLLSEPGMDVLRNLGGIKKLMNWDKWIISDSGGFQMFSLIHKNKVGSISKNGVSFHIDTRGGRKNFKITPEKCIQIQFDINSDIMIVLDYFTPFNADDEEIKKSVDVTIKWAKRCKDEFEKQCKLRGLTEETRPLLFGVVQGAHSFSERERCAKELKKIGFDGYGLGGWVFEETGKTLDLEIIDHIAKSLPGEILYGLGVGTPQDIVNCIKLGYTIFDCVLPTRDARHKRIYVFKKDPSEIKNIFDEKDWSGFLYMGKDKYQIDEKPLSEYCDCYACKNYSRAYINHLFKIEDALAWKLATIHNLRMYSKTMELAREAMGAL